MRQNEIEIKEHDDTDEIEREIRDLNKLFESRCKYCGKKVDLRHCSFDIFESPVCYGGCK